MEKNETSNIEGSRFITLDQRQLIRELRDLCFLRGEKERKNFIKIVLNSVGAENLNQIKSEDFGTAYLTALALLHKAGENVFKPQ